MPIRSAEDDDPQQQPHTGPFRAPNNILDVPRNTDSSSRRDSNEAPQSHPDDDEQKPAKLSKLLCSTISFLIIFLLIGCIVFGVMCWVATNIAQYPKYDQTSCYIYNTVECDPNNCVYTWYYSDYQNRIVFENVQQRKNALSPTQCWYLRNTPGSLTFIDPSYNYNTWVDYLVVAIITIVGLMALSLCTIIGSVVIQKKLRDLEKLENPGPPVPNKMPTLVTSHPVEDH
jgi:hypothetical protein